jgi:hypothetical protein
MARASAIISSATLPWPAMTCGWSKGGLRRLSLPPRSWLWATGALLTLQQLCRLVTPPGPNVNIAFAVYTGWERIYPTYRIFWTAMCLQATVVYLLSELALRRLLWPSKPQ